MKISHANVSLYRVPPHMKEPMVDAVQTVEAVELVAVKLFTDEGTSGWGFTYTIGRGGGAIKYLIAQELIPLSIGENPLNVERIWKKLWWACHWIGREGITTMGIAAIDNALWDLKAKHFGVPLYRLLGGYRDKVPAYASICYLNLSLEEMKTQIKDFIQQGFKGVKIAIGSEDPQKDLERIREARSVVGNNVRVMIDANQKFTLDEALRTVNLLRDLDISWFEEPLHCNQPQAHCVLRAKSSIPIAIGESLYSKYAFKDYIEQGGVDIVQPDAGRLGITEWMKVANMAECWGLPVAPHTLHEIHAHLIAAIPNGLIVEYVPIIDSILATPLRARDGVIDLPQTSGHGMELSEERSAELLVEEVSIRL